MEEENKVKTNPNGANKFHLDPRQKLCWDFYTNPNSETFGNATQSAIKAGYTDGTANTITANDWFIGRLWRLNATFTGEKKIKQLMELDLLNGGKKVDVGIARIQADLAKLMVTTQGKNEGYSTKNEQEVNFKGEIKDTTEPMPEDIREKLAKLYEEEMRKKILEG